MYFLVVVHSVWLTGINGLPIQDHSTVVISESFISSGQNISVHDMKVHWKEGNGLFNDALNTFYLRLYGVGHMVKDHLDSEIGNPLLPHGLLFLIISKGSFICTIPQTG